MKLGVQLQHLIYLDVISYLFINNSLKYVTQYICVLIIVQCSYLSLRTSYSVLKFCLCFSANMLLMWNMKMRQCMQMGRKLT